MNLLAPAFRAPQQVGADGIDAVVANGIGAINDQMGGVTFEALPSRPFFVIGSQPLAVTSLPSSSLAVVPPPALKPWEE